MNDMFISHTPFETISYLKVSTPEILTIMQPYIIAVASFAVGYIVRDNKRLFYQTLYSLLYRKH
jgi:hypothetical protein